MRELSHEFGRVEWAKVPPKFTPQYPSGTGGPIAVPLFAESVEKAHEMPGKYLSGFSAGGVKEPERWLGECLELIETVSNEPNPKGGARGQRFEKTRQRALEALYEVYLWLQETIQSHTEGGVYLSTEYHKERKQRNNMGITLEEYEGP